MQCSFILQSPHHPLQLVFSFPKCSYASAKLPLALLAGVLAQTDWLDACGALLDDFNTLPRYLEISNYYNSANSYLFDKIFKYSELV